MCYKSTNFRASLYKPKINKHKKKCNLGSYQIDKCHAVNQDLSGFNKPKPKQAQEER